MTNVFDEGAINLNHNCSTSCSAYQTPAKPHAGVRTPSTWKEQARRSPKNYEEPLCLGGLVSSGRLQLRRSVIELRDFRNK